MVSNALCSSLMLLGKQERMSMEEQRDNDELTWVIAAEPRQSGNEGMIGRIKGSMCRSTCATCESCSPFWKLITTDRYSQPHHRHHPHHLQ